MANFEQVMKLVDAGYTKAEIDALMQPAAAAPAQEETGAPAAPEPEQTEGHTTPEKTAARPDPEQDTQAAILAAINKLSNAMITNNINTQMQPGEPTRSVEQALAEIIAPPPAEKRKI